MCCTRQPNNLINNEMFGENPYPKDGSANWNLGMVSWLLTYNLYKTPPEIPIKLNSIKGLLYVESKPNLYQVTAMFGNQYIQQDTK